MLDDGDDTAAGLGRHAPDRVQPILQLAEYPPQTEYQGNEGQGRPGRPEGFAARVLNQRGDGRGPLLADEFLDFEEDLLLGAWAEQHAR